MRFKERGALSGLLRATGSVATVSLAAIRIPALISDLICIFIFIWTLIFICSCCFAQIRKTTFFTQGSFRNPVILCCTVFVHCGFPSWCEYLDKSWTTGATTTAFADSAAHCGVGSRIDPGLAVLISLVGWICLFSTGQFSTSFYCAGVGSLSLFTGPLFVLHSFWHIDHLLFQLVIWLARHALGWLNSLHWFIYTTCRLTGVGSHCLLTGPVTSDWCYRYLIIFLRFTGVGFLFLTGLAIHWNLLLFTRTATGITGHLIFNLFGRIVPSSADIDRWAPGTLPL